MAGHEPEPRPRRLTRAEARARTREQLLAAATRVFARKGYAGASVEEIAESAGYSTGALYSNFASKQQLFLELMTTRRSRAIARQAADTADILDPDTADGDPFAPLALRLERAADRSDEAAALQAEFWLYAVRNPEAMETLAALADDRIDALTPLITHLMQQQGTSPAVAPQTVTRIVLALVHGLARQRCIDPAVPADLLTQAVQWLLAGLPTDNQPPCTTAPQTPPTARRASKPTDADAGRAG